MRQRFKNLWSFICVFLAVTLTVTAGYATEYESIAVNTAAVLKEKVQSPSVSSVGGEWTIIALGGNHMLTDEYAMIYYNNLCKAAAQKEGVLHSRKYTEYARAVLALGAMGQNPENVAGYNLLLPLRDFDSVIRQGINGAVYALLALNNYPGGENLQMCEKYKEYILSKQNRDGGFSLGGASETDITAMAVQALAVAGGCEEAVEKALAFLAGVQSENGGFEMYGEETLESCAQVIIAMCAAKIDINDPRFVKNGLSPLDNLLGFYNGEGFGHIKSDLKTNVMSTEQALCALAALKRFENGESFLYNYKKEDFSQINRIEGINRNVILQLAKCVESKQAKKVLQAVLEKTA